MTLLDVTMAVAARSVQKDMGAVTIEMKTSFMQPARGKLTGKGHLMHRTATMAFTEGTVFDEQGRPAPMPPAPSSTSSACPPGRKAPMQPQFG